MKKRGIFVSALAVCVLAFVLLCGCASAKDATCNVVPLAAVDDGYVMQDMQVTADASRGDRSVHVIETYNFTFKTASHGFYRDFPLNSGEKIRNLKVYDADGFGNAYKVSHENSDFLRVYVGKENRTVYGENLRCTMEYTMLTPAHAEYPDAIVLNVIGQGWSCEIKNATVTVKLPAATNETPRYYYGGWGMKNDATPIVSVAPQAGKSEYTFSLTHPLGGYKGLTVYYFLPKGVLHTRNETLLWIILPAALVLVAAALAVKLTVGKNKPLAPVTNYYPPKHADGQGQPMDPVDMGYIIDHTCQASDVTSLIFYFASKGYLDLIEPKTDENPSSSFMLRKKSDLPRSAPKYQHLFFNKLFSFGNEVTVKELTNKTYTAVQSVQMQVRNKYRGVMYSRGAFALSGVMSVLVALFAVLTVFFCGRRVSAAYLDLRGFVCLPAVIVGYFGMGYIGRQWYRMGPQKRGWLLAGCVLLTAALALLLAAIVESDVLGLAERITLALATAAGVLVAASISRRTSYYDSELNEVLGFKDFLCTAERERLEMLLEENPQYYYDILPYANVLGVSSIWQNKFEGLTLQPPHYYSGGTLFDLYVFNRLYSSSYRAYSTASISRPSSSSRSGGGFSGGGGGGFSGGGFGGGGGGRW